MNTNPLKGPTYGTKQAVKGRSHIDNLPKGSLGLNVVLALDSDTNLTVDVKGVCWDFSTCGNGWAVIESEMIGTVMIMVNNVTELSHVVMVVQRFGVPPVTLSGQVRRDRFGPAPYLMTNVNDWLNQQLINL